ncbi:hypothetical protein B0T26DRAFT_677542 [Lasiosphaeria miniovina]|uniref:Uncharacterized protein n=1 Tax=Lasiosphaeria miniovina TaxID=1954250 RepID=A0AA40ACI5_9PEZI|nr:uncharacterized protein B0T26DRAFT_677542 [Lasiosphaeria miniovina]KAK0713173.1 hypothetical protein B0T26DRAFT_677542 [Lasiosphaeria miniovina]
MRVWRVFSLVPNLFLAKRIARVQVFIIGTLYLFLVPVCHPTIPSTLEGVIGNTHFAGTIFMERDAVPKRMPRPLLTEKGAQAHGERGAGFGVDAAPEKMPAPRILQRDNMCRGLVGGEVMTKE